MWSPGLYSNLVRERQDKGREVVGQEERLGNKRHD